MPKVEIGNVYGVYVRAEAAEASVEDLFAKARAEFENACKVVGTEPPGPAGGLTTETRWFPSHTNPSSRTNAGFSPVKAETTQEAT